MSKPVCVVVGIGPKNGAAFARRFHKAGYRVALLSRTTEYSKTLAKELGDAKAYACDASEPDSIKTTFAAIREEMGDPEVLVYNAGSGSWKKFEETTANDLEGAFRLNALGMVTAAQEVLPAMRRAKKGSIVVVGATASLRGKPMTTGFAAAKAAQRSLAQSMARQFWPEGIHVTLLILDGVVGEAGSSETGAIDKLDPNDIALAAWQVTEQPPSTWTFELDIKPKSENW